MKAHFEFLATERKDIGKGASRRQRRQGLIPAIIYGAGKEAESISLDHNKIIHASANESFYSSILSIKVGKHKAEDVIFKDIQRHAFKPQILHLDFQRVQADVALHVNVPLHFEGEDKAPGVKDRGILSRLVTEVEISCLPKFLPEYLVVDVSHLGLNETLHLSDIKLPEGVSLLSLTGNEPHDLPVVSIHIPKEVADIDVSAGVTEVLNEKKDADAAPAKDAGKKEG